MAQIWHSHKPAVKAITWKSHSMAWFLCLIPLLSPVLETLALAPLKVSGILAIAVCMFPLWVRVIPRYLNLVTSSSGIPLYWKLWVAEVSLLKKMMHAQMSCLQLPLLHAQSLPSAADLLLMSSFLQCVYMLSGRIMALNCKQCSLLQCPLFCMYAVCTPLRNGAKHVEHMKAWLNPYLTESAMLVEAVLDGIASASRQRCAVSRVCKGQWSFDGCN